MTKQLSQQQIDAFWEQGYLVVEDAVSPDLLTKLIADFSAWVAASRQHQDNYGETQDGRARFDLQPGHSHDNPALRRVNSPVEISDNYYEASMNSAMTDFVAQLIGPNITFHHDKINSKLPKSKTQVKWHQDFPFTPHTNDDLITALLMVDEVTEENGPLKVIPGSHKGDIHNLWHDGKFTGAVTEAIAQQCEDNAITCTGKAGSVCLMHTRLLHGSSINASTEARTLHITVYAAEDAISCAANPIPNCYEGQLVRGTKTNTVRCQDIIVPLPEKPEQASFFAQQASEPAS